MPRKSGVAAILSRAFRLWWGDFMLLLFFNIVWFALQFPIFTGPAATAAMYAIARRIVDRELVGPSHGRDALRHMLWPSLRWAAINLAVVMAQLGRKLWIHVKSSKR